MKLSKRHQNLLKALLFALCVALLLGFAFDSFAGYFDDDFDSYSIGEFYGNGVWTIGATGTYFISGNTFLSYPNSLFTILGSGVLMSKDYGANITDGRFKFSVSAPATATDQNARMIIIGQDTDGDDCFKYDLKFIQVDEFSFRYFNRGGSDITLITYDVPTGFHSSQVEWRAGEMKYKVDESVWSDWEDNRDANCDGVAEIEISSFSGKVAEQLYFENFIQTEAYGICGSGADCLYCSTESDCENAGCYWIMLPFPFAWVCSPVDPLIETATGTQYDFTSYYASNSQFSTPTDFISRLASATQPFLLVMSGWLESFSDLFDLAEAEERGEQLGNAVPQARGYLNFFNSLFADLPLSEIFLIYLVIFIGIIIFRVIRQVKKLIAV